MRTGVLAIALLSSCKGCSASSNSDGPGGPGGSGTSGPGGPGDPGTVVLHRLNRTEYDNTVHDLLGTNQTPARDFPSDDTVAGWDNIASVLSISPLHIELYELAAQSLADEIVAVPLLDPIDYRAEGEGPDVVTTVGGSSGESWCLWSNGDLTATFDAPQDGTYTLSARVWADQAGPDIAQASLGHDGLPDLTVDVAATSANDAELLSVDVALTQGPHTVTVSFLNDYYDQVAGQDRNLYVDWVDSYGPIDVELGPNPLHDRWVTCDPAAIGAGPCVEQVLREMAPRAWRRPVSEDEYAGLMGIVDGVLADGGTFDEGLKWGIVAVLMSPSFVYRVEVDPAPGDPAQHALDPYELASRLSYFLWSSMADDLLFEAAANDELRTPQQIEVQVLRMLADPRASALVDNFGGQWLFIRGIDDVTKDSITFPTYDEVLRASMREEMERFLESFVFARRDMRELLTATEGEIDNVLADHYGIPRPGTGWETVDLSAYGRGGVLGQAGMLTVESYPTRTSPVIRGKYVLGQLLCDEPPPPPPDVPALDEDSDAHTVREQLEQHRADPVCASCHETMDNIGFALENYDAIGAYRTEDNGWPIDATGELDGVSFEGQRPLSELIAADPRFTGCMVERLFTYGLGRLPTIEDGAYVHAIEEQFGADGYTFESLAIAIATSEPFTTRRGEP